MPFQNIEDWFPSFVLYVNIFLQIKRSEQQIRLIIFPAILYFPASRRGWGVCVWGVGGGLVKWLPLEAHETKGAAWQQESQVSKV